MSNRAKYRRFAEKIDEQQFIFNVVEQTFNALQEPLLDINKEKITRVDVIWSNKLKTTAGHASNGTIITLSNALWERANIEQRRELVTHESCHLVIQRNRLKLLGHANYFANYEDDEERYNYRSHGKAWQKAMQICGYENPKRCHAIKPVRRYFLYICSCHDINNPHKIKIRLHNANMRKEIHGIRCNLCKGLCTFVKELKDLE